MDPFSKNVTEGAMGGGWMQFPETMSDRFASGRTADQFTAFNKLKVDAEKGGSFWGNMSGIEQIYFVNALASLGSAALSGEEKIPRAGVDMLGGMGMFSQAPQRQIPSFDEWRSQRGSYG